MQEEIRAKIQYDKCFMRGVNESAMQEERGAQLSGVEKGFSEEVTFQLSLAGLQEIAK